MSETLAKRDPAIDGWDTEVITEQVNTQLKVIGGFLAHPDEIDIEQLSALTADGFSCTPLRPTHLQPVPGIESPTVLRPAWAADQAVPIHRLETGATPDTETTPETETSAAPQSQTGVSTNGPRAVQGLAAALADLAAPFDPAADVHVKFKIIGVKTEADLIEIEAHYFAAGHSSRGLVQQNANWHSRWTRADPQSRPLLKWIQVTNYEEIIGPERGGAMFADCTTAVLGANPSFHEQLLPGLNHWRARLQASLGVDLFGYQGLAIGDVNGDGLDDLFLCQPGGLPNRLFVQNEDGTATDVSADAGVDLLDRSSAALLIDLDNDGDQDLVVMAYDSVLIYSNDGTGRFSSAGEVAHSSSSSMAAADYDLDGDLDLYVCGYSAPTGRDNTPIPYHDANNGLPNRLLRNDGGWRFTDVTESSGLQVNNRRYSFAASWEDYDNDGDDDLYVANDFGRNNLYRNDGGVFTDVAPVAGVEDISAGMGVTWGDYNNDGLMDIYVSNMFSSAGNRVSYQRQFRPGDDDSTRALFQRHARGNSLFANLGDGTFRDVSTDAGVTMGRWAWGSRFLDINNDGLEDILVANGYITNDDTGDL
ncbi:MAG: VCBS repeat-containing protein [Planctomycetes bacterium]|nr:VCBS repeat-containing protein [Planctomycetota bacterium]